MLVSCVIAEKLASNEETLSPDAAADADAETEAEADSEAGADVVGTGVPVAAGVVGDGDAPDEQPATMAATATNETASFLVSKIGLLLLSGSAA
jgi:hypothetical protein